MSLILSVALPHLVLLGAGLGIVSGLKKIFRWTKINAFIYLSLSYLIGELFVVVFLFFSSLIFSRFLWPVLWGFLAAFFLIWLVRIVRLKEKRTLWGKGWKKAFSLRNIAPVLLILLVCFPNIRISFYDSLSQQDPRLIWFFHGKAFFYDNQIDPTYLTNPEYIWSQPSYPVFVSLLSVYHARFLGYWHEILNKSFIFFHWIASLILLYFLLRAQRIPPIFALLGIAFLPMIYHKFAMIGISDSIWALNFLIGITLCLSSLEKGAESSSGRFPLLLGYSFLSMVALTKNEGLAGSLVFISLFSLISLAAKKHLFRTLVFLFGFYALLVFPWYVFTTVHHIKLLWPKPPLGFLRFTFPEIVQRAKFILIYPFREKLLVPEIFYFMVGSLGLSLALLLGNIKRTSKFLGSWLILATNILLLFIFFLIYLGTPQPLEFELIFALERLLTVNFMLCLLTLLFLTQSHTPLASNPLE